MTSSMMRLTQGIHRALSLYPRRRAVVSAEGEITWEQFADRVARLAGALRELGVGPGDRVAMLALNSPRYVEYYFAVLWAGGVLAPVNCRWASGEKAHCLNDSGAKVLLADAAHLPEALELLEACGSVSHLVSCAQVQGAATAALGYESLVSASRPVEDAGRGGAERIWQRCSTRGGPPGVPKE